MGKGAALKVEEPSPVSPVIAKVGERGITPPSAPETPGGGDHGDEPDAPPEQDGDIAALHGVDERDIEPNLRRVFIDLLEEVAHLREDLERNHKRVYFLEDLADRDPLSALLNRRAFVRELTHGLTLMTNDQGQGCLVILHVRNLREIHQTHGLAVADGVIEHVGALLGGNMMLGDVMGRIEGAAFGLILVGRDRVGAQEEAIAMAALLESHPLVWQSATIPLAVHWALHVLSPGENAAEALAAVDAALQSQA